jgi:hypothetical protein
MVNCARSTGDANAEVYRMRLQTDKWCFKYELVRGFEILHYVSLTLTDEDEGEYFNVVWVTLLGRLTHCSFCQQQTHWGSMCMTRAEKPTSNLLRQKPEETSRIQVTPTTTQEHTRRPKSKFNHPDKTPRKTKDVAFASPEETEFQITKKRRKQRNTTRPKRKQQQRRQNRLPRLLIPASDREDDIPDQRETGDHWKKSFMTVFQKCTVEHPQQTTNRSNIC